MLESRRRGWNRLGSRTDRNRWDNRMGRNMWGMCRDMDCMLPWGRTGEDLCAGLSQ